jgi:hypothetical protein
MQITDPAYNWVVLPNQRMADARQCDTYSGKLSRCNPVDAVELAARVLLVKVGMWDFLNFVPTGSIDLLQEVYCSASGYYGSTNPDTATNARGDNLGVPDHPAGGTNYSEIVCYDRGSGVCSSASDYPNPRPPARGCMSWPGWP